MNLEALSRRYETGLVTAQRWIETEDLASFLKAWDEELAPSFASEERFLGPLLRPEERERLGKEIDELVDAVDAARNGEAPGAEVGNHLRDHLLWKQAELLPRLTKRSNAVTLGSLAFEVDRRQAKRPAAEETVAADLGYLTAAAAFSGPIWAHESSDLDVTLLTWKAGEGIAEHLNEEVDVLIVALAGDAEIVLNEERTNLRAGQCVLIPKGIRRGLTAGAEGFSHLNVHRRRKAMAPAMNAGAFRQRPLPKD